MAVKTITIDMTAYDLLSLRKRDGMSFSDVIKAHFTGRPNAATLRAVLPSVRVSADALEGMEAQVKARRASPARTVAL